MGDNYWTLELAMEMWRFQCNVGKFDEVIMLPTKNGSQISGNSIRAGHVEISGAILMNQGGGLCHPLKMRHKYGALEFGLGIGRFHVQYW
jgi:hypothetical protein